MKFATPNAFWFLLLLPVLAGLWVAAGKRARQLVHQLVAVRLEKLLVGEPSGRKVRFILLLAGVTAAVLALARPQWGQVSSDTKGRGRDVIIIVDVSRSMLANDLPPNRLQRAKLAAEDLVRQLPSDRIGLVAFAGSAFLQAPITADHNAVLTAIHELDPEIIPLPGTNLSGALQCADDAFDRSEGGQRAIVLITDGEDLEADAVSLAREMAAKMRIFTVGVGSVEGAVLMVPSARGGMEYIRDAAGNMVQSKLDEARLLQIAEAGGGFYTHLVSGPAEMRKIAKEGIDTMEEHDVLLQSRSRAVERYQWPLGLGLLLLGAGLCVGEKPRRNPAVPSGALAGVLVFLAGFSLPVDAAVSKGRTLYDSGNYPEAQAAFGDELRGDPNSPQRAFNFGVAAYKNKKWVEAIEAFGQALASQDPQLRSRAEYNLANSLVQQARQGRRGQDNETLGQALAHYEEALKRDPAFDDAKSNRDFVKRLLEKQQEQQEQQDKGKNDKKDKNKDKDDKQQQDKNGEQGDDSESKDGEKQSKDEKSSQGKEGESSKDDGSGKGKEGKDGKSGDSKQQGQPDAQNGKPSEPEAPGEQKERGELKDSPTVKDAEKGEREAQREREAQMAQAMGGKMTKQQADALMQALRSEDRRVQLWGAGKVEGQAQAKGGKTW